MSTTTISFLSNPIVIQSAITFVGILFTAILTFHFSQRRYIFEKLFDRKLFHIEQLYGKVLELELCIKKYISLTGADMSEESIEKKRAEIGDLRKKFFDLQRSFWEKEIALDESSANALKTFIDASNEILAKLHVSQISQQQRDHNTSFDYWDKAYETMTSKLLVAKEKLKSDFKKVNSMQKL